MGRPRRRRSDTYAFYWLPCDEFSQTELEEYAVKTWPWTPKPKVRRGEETSWFCREPVVDLNAGWNIDTHNGHFHFYMPFREITGLTVSWDIGGSVS